jgi:hypothetical protein
MKYLRMTPEDFQQRGVSNADIGRFVDTTILFCDFDELFQRFMNECPIKEIGNMVGLEMKSKNTIIEPWPMRLKMNATQDEFDVLLASDQNGSERYVEWKRID